MGEKYIVFMSFEIFCMFNVADGPHVVPSSGLRSHKYFLRSDLFVVVLVQMIIYFDKVVVEQPTDFLSVSVTQHTRKTTVLKSFEIIIGSPQVCSVGWKPKGKNMLCSLCIVDECRRKKTSVP